MLRSFLYYFILVLTVGILILSCQPKAADKSFPVLKGPWLGQAVPDSVPEIFAPGIVSTALNTRDIAIMPDGSEIYFMASVGGYSLATILVSRQTEAGWTEPEVADFANNPDYLFIEPCISPDGLKMFFVSTRPDSLGKPKRNNQDIWVMDREGDGWSEPRNLGAPVNSEVGEFYPSVARSGNLYFTRDFPSGSSVIFRSIWKDGKYLEPEKLPERVNAGATRFNAFVDPDEEFMIVPIFGLPSSFGSVDYYIVYRNSADQWSEPINLGSKINTPGGQEYAPYVSPDGNFFFFMSSRFEKDKFGLGESITFGDLKRIHNSPGNGNYSIYWIRADFVETCRDSCRW